MTVLYPNPEEGDTLLGHTLIADPCHILPKMMVHIPAHTPSCVDDDDAFLPDLSPDLAQTETEPATATPVHTERTLSAAEILADLAESAVVSGHDESAQSPNLQVEVSTNSEWQTRKEAKREEEVDVVNTQEVEMENTQYEDQTMETTDPDLIVSGMQDIKPMAFHPFSPYMRE